jgi:titin
VQGSSNTIGGTTTAARNIISGNTKDGVHIDSSASTNVVEGNSIGVSTSTTALPNKGYGVSIAGSNNTVGGSTTAAGNHRRQ